MCAGRSLRSKKPQRFHGRGIYFAADVPATADVELLLVCTLRPPVLHRFLVSPLGLKVVLEKFSTADYGRCPRYNSKSCEEARGLACPTSKHDADSSARNAVFRLPSVLHLHRTEDDYCRKIMEGSSLSFRGRLFTLSRTKDRH